MSAATTMHGPGHVPAECSLGSVLVARSTKGVCAILLGDDPEHGPAARMRWPSPSRAIAS